MLRPVKTHTDRPGADPAHTSMPVDSARPLGGAQASFGRRLGGAGLSGLGAVAAALALGWAVLFIALGVWSRLQLFADGSMFSYAVAVQDAWAFHWHNVSVRSTVWLLFLAPAELFVRLTGDAGAGVALYGWLHFAAPLASFALTWPADRSPGRALFVAACGSTVCLLPLVFGFPTEMWAAHALFWPTYALSRSARSGAATGLALSAAFTLMVLTHEGALVLGAVPPLTCPRWRCGAQSSWRCRRTPTSAASSDRRRSISSIP